MSDAAEKLYDGELSKPSGPLKFLALLVTLDPITHRSIPRRLKPTSPAALARYIPDRKLKSATMLKFGTAAVHDAGVHRIGWSDSNSLASKTTVWTPAILMLTCPLAGSL